MPKVEVYGGDHSPWVQAVLLGLHDHHIDHSLRSVPPLNVFVSSGVMMPATKFDNGPWQLDSGKILESIGYDPISAKDSKLVTATWQGVLHRPDNPWKFFHGFSLNRDEHPSFRVRMYRHLLRPFITFYFFALIKFLVLTGKRKEPASYADQFEYWNRKLKQNGGAYYGGEKPNTIDLQLFGIIQCHCSIPFGPLIEALQTDPTLVEYRNWIARMQERFADYPHLYSAAYFPPFLPSPVAARFSEKTAFWLGTLLMIILFPLTITLLITVFLRR